MNKSLNYLDPEILASIHPFHLRAKSAVEGLVAGMHRSPLKGHSAEFAQHREYVPGDDIRQVDWKVFARSDRYYLKQFEDETNLIVYILVDQSESMDYRGSSSPWSKRDYAQILACCLAFMITNQQDQAGLVTYSDQVEHWLPASSSPAQLDNFIQILELDQEHRETDLQAAISSVTHRLARPCMAILISDFLGEQSKMEQAIRLLRYAGHDLLAFQVLDRDEVEFPFQVSTEFDGLEGLGNLTVDPMLIAGAYRRAVRELQSSLERVCRQQDAEFHALCTAEPLSLDLPRILARRSRGN